MLMKLALRKAHTKKSLEDLMTTQNLTIGMIGENRAILNELNQMSQDGYNPEARKAMFQKQLEALLDTSAHASKDIIGWQGVEAEQTWLGDYLKP